VRSDAHGKRSLAGNDRLTGLAGLRALSDGAGGFKVATNAVRDVIAAHPAVAEACVIGVPDRRLGQVPVAAVELRRGADPVSADDIVAWARERLTGYQVPVELQILDELPRTPSMKVSQAALRPLFRHGDS
jgi:long-chain acyl-CoA synthetase